MKILKNLAITFAITTIAGCSANRYETEFECITSNGDTFNIKSNTEEPFDAKYADIEINKTKCKKVKVKNKKTISPYF